MSMTGHGFASDTSGKVDMSKTIKVVKKSAPRFTFPVNTKRVFADYKHKTLVPSPDTYYKE